ncbi:MAG: OPT family oligopeptide transporter [Oscillospiraceae bacterium]
MKKDTDFKPYIPSSKVTAEFTASSIITGIITAVVFSASNAYLGLRVGMTVSASIPAAVIAMSVMRMLSGKNSVLESNIVQTIGSAGESIASGAIFTLPALFLWAAQGTGERPSIFEITVIAVIGGLLGVFFMIPLRNALIVREHGTLPYPEGTACAQVLIAGQKGGTGASAVFGGMGAGAFFKFLIDGLKAVPEELALRFKSFGGEIGTQLYPAVMSVGYICGFRISSYMLAGGVMSWLVLIPAIVNFGGETVMYPSENATVAQLYSEGGASAIWQNYIRYIGAGALAAGGLISLVRSLPLIFKTFRASLSAAGRHGRSTERTERELDFRFVIAAVAVLTLALWLIPVIPVNLVGAIITVVFGFFFAAVSSRMVGLVGSSNNPVSGMTIATLLAASLLLKAMGMDSTEGMIAAVAIGSVISIIASVAGDTSQDLKTGYILGATPVKQQIGEIIGASAASLVIGGTLYLLDSAWGFGTPELAAPQAMLMKMITEGVMTAQLPWNLVFIGAFAAVAAELMGIPVLPFAIGSYLPVRLSACIFIGGVIRHFAERRKADEKAREAAINKGVLFSSGMIAGEGLIGILLAFAAVFGVSGYLDISEYTGKNSSVPIVLGVLVLTSIILLLVKFSRPSREARTE